MSLFAEELAAYAPGYMKGPRGLKLIGACGQAFDAMAARFWDGRDASSVADCAPEVLPYHASDRGLRLYGQEPLASKRARLAQWRQLHRRRGTHRGALEHVQPYFLPAALPRVRIVHQSGSGVATWHGVDAARSYSMLRAFNWNYDGQITKWSRYWAIVYPGEAGYAASHVYGDGHTYGDGSVYGGLTATQIADLTSIFLDWKAAHSRLAAIVVAWDSASFDPSKSPAQDATGWWSLPNGKWGSTIDPVTHLGTRPPTAQWIYEDQG